MTANSGERGEPSAATRPPASSAGAIPADTFAVRLYLARFHAGRLSIEKAAERCGLNSGNWVRWEDGALPRDKVEVAQAVSDGLGIDFDWLLLGGPLLSGRGRVTVRRGGNTVGYPRLSRWPIVVGTNGGRRAKIPATRYRRRRTIDRSKPVAGTEMSPASPLLSTAA